MDLFTEHYAHDLRAALEIDINRATRLAPFVAATKSRPRRGITRIPLWRHATIRPAHQPTKPSRPVPTASST
jgi:hypothetical protein